MVAHLPSNTAPPSSNFWTAWAFTSGTTSGRNFDWQDVRIPAVS